MPCALLEAYSIMVTIRSTPETVGDDMVITARSRQCSYCLTPIVWLRTYLRAQSYCFDATAHPRGTVDKGWIPGVFDVAGRTRIVMAPLARHDPARQATAAQVMVLHRCPGSPRR